MYCVFDTVYLIVSPTFSSLKNLEAAPVKVFAPFDVVMLPDSCGLSKRIVSPSSCATYTDDCVTSKSDSIPLHRPVTLVTPSRSTKVQGCSSKKVP